MGGGSGGHITPIAAVCGEIHHRHPKADLRVWCDGKFADRLRDMLAEDAPLVRVDAIVSGKFRRYANLTLRQHLRYHIFRTHLMNFLDAFKITLGFFQSFFKLIIWRPDVVFCKGGFVCLPVGLAAQILRIPLVIHDSDTVPGLTNRILARFALRIGTGSPIENYPNYPKSKMTYIGIPVRKEIRKLNLGEKIAAKIELGFDPKKILIFVVGGGGGAARISREITKISTDIVTKDCQILLLVGKDRAKLIDIPKSAGSDFKVIEFMTNDMAKAIGAADIVITRAGATAIAEFATVGAVTIIIPSPHLAGDHQTKNANVYKQAKAAIVIEESDIASDPGIILESLKKILEDKGLRHQLSSNLEKFAKPDALDRMVDMILRNNR